MKKALRWSVLLFCTTTVSFAQMNLDIELKTGITINGDKYNYHQDIYHSYLRNGFSYGLGFDLWWPNNFSLSWGYLLSQSSAVAVIELPSWYQSTQQGRISGYLKDRIFYLGAKKKIQVWKTGHIIPFLGVFYNPYFFDFRDQNSSAFFQSGDVFYYNQTHTYTRYNSIGVGYGSTGLMAGLTLEQEVANIGRFSLQISYAMPINKDLHRSDFIQMEIAQYDLNMNVLNGYEYLHLNKFVEARSLFQIELGYKMPCSILFGGKEK